MDSNNWRKASYSGSQGGNCVEVSARRDILVRDSQRPEGDRLMVPASAWKAFTKRVQRGQ